jgi:PAS domain S-box-containing protein
MSEGTLGALRTTALFVGLVVAWVATGVIVLGRGAGPYNVPQALFDAVFLAAACALIFAQVRQARGAWMAAEDGLRRMVDQPLAGVYLIQGGRFRFVNRKFAETLGYTAEELVESVGVDDVIHPEDRDHVLERMRGRLEGAQQDVNHTFRAVRKDGLAVPVEVWGRGTDWMGEPALAGVMIDQSSRQALARQLRRSQKLEAIGEFTGAIAHDFNNLLTAIVTPIQLALADLDDDSPLRGHLEEVESAAARGAALSRQLLAFSRKQVVQPRPHDLNEVVRSLEPMLGRLLGTGVTLVTELDADLQTVVVDATQMEQLLVNLVVNARDAMPSGGAVRVVTANVDPATDPVRSDAPEPPVGWVRLTVADSGMGFDETVRKRIFEPYFTTKEDGTGLGLATVYGIARQAGGFVRVESSPGAGATFRVYVPAVDAVAEPLRSPRKGSEALRGGSENILVVEDQAPVRQVVVRALTRFGYRVADAPSGKEALERVDEVTDGLDLLITDVMLPGQSGPEVAEVIRDKHPGLKVLYMSGYADREAFGRIEAGENWMFLSKPFSVEDLLSMVRRVLDRSEGKGQEVPG